MGSEGLARNRTCDLAAFGGESLQGGQINRVRRALMLTDANPRAEPRATRVVRALRGHHLDLTLNKDGRPNANDTTDCCQPKGKSHSKRQLAPFKAALIVLASAQYRSKEIILQPGVVYRKMWLIPENPIQSQRLLQQKVPVIGLHCRWREIPLDLIEIKLYRPRSGAHRNSPSGSMRPGRQTALWDAPLGLQTSQWCRSGRKDQ
jgi:hypothetical protein